MGKRRGFTLIETLITTFVLVTGLAAVAGLFSYGARTGLENRQRTAATALLSSKIEELRHTGHTETLHVLAPGQYSEYLSIESDGRTVTTGDDPAQYLRTWEIDSETPQHLTRVTITVLSRRPKGRSYQELARATLLVGPGF
jgi:prepilin-type N-terminal cleavage/methylation domain-containing protein